MRQASDTSEKIISSTDQLMKILEKVGSLDENDKSFVTDANVLGYLD